MFPFHWPRPYPGLSSGSVGLSRNLFPGFMMLEAGTAGEGASAGLSPFCISPPTPSPASPKARGCGAPRYEGVSRARAHAEVPCENPLPWARLSAAGSTWMPGGFPPQPCPLEENGKARHRRRPCGPRADLRSKAVSIPPSRTLGHRGCRLPGAAGVSLAVGEGHLTERGSASITQAQLPQKHVLGSPRE